MSLVIQSVTYRNFRNLGQARLEPSESFTIIHGPNAAGKTNSVEGVSLLCNGVSFRSLHSSADLIGPKTENAQVSQRLVGDKRVVDVRCDVVRAKRSFTINGKPRRANECPKFLPCVLFNPDDLQVIKGSASGRRDLVDQMGTQLNETYRRVLRDYKRSLSQRNSLLKAGIADGELFESWTAALVNAGSVLCLYRGALVRRLAPLIDEAYGRLSGFERLVVDYFPSVQASDDDRDQVMQAFHRELEERRPEELARHATCVGPHRDDLVFSIDGREVRSFGSQGQQRSSILAVKMAHAALVREMMGHFPVFVLDDVMSELDANRRRALFSLIDTGMQTIVTTANLEYFTDEEIDRARAVSIQELKGDLHGGD